MDHSELDKLAKVAADVFNEVSKVIHGAGVFTLFSLTPDFTMVGGEDWNKVKSQISSLGDEERKAVEGVFASNLNLVNKDVQAKILSSENLLEKAVELAEKQIALIKQEIELFNEMKALLS